MDNAYYLYVDSALRSSGTNSNFTFDTVPNKTIQSRAKVAVSSLTFVNSIFQITTRNNTLNFTVVTAGPTTNNYTLSITPGNYTVNSLIGPIGTAMNNLTAANNTSMPKITINGYTTRLQFRKYAPGETGALAGEVAATYNLLSSSTIKEVLGFTDTVSFTNAIKELPNMYNMRPTDYIYLTSPNIQSSSFAPYIGGNAILARIRILSSTGGIQTIDTENIEENLVNCSYIPMQWTFSLVDKYGQAIDMQLPFSFTLRIIPEN